MSLDNSRKDLKNKMGIYSIKINNIFWSNNDKANNILLNLIDNFHKIIEKFLHKLLNYHQCKLPHKNN
jgi:hypothetical protein